MNILPHRGSVILVFCYLPYARLTDIFLRLRTQFRRDDIDLFQTRMMVPKKMPWQIIDQRKDGQLAAVTRFLPLSPFWRIYSFCELPFLCRQTQSGNYPRTCRKNPKKSKLFMTFVFQFLLARVFSLC